MATKKTTARRKTRAGGKTAPRKAVTASRQARKIKVGGKR